MKMNKALLPSGYDENLAMLLLCILNFNINIQNSLVMKDISKGLGITLDFNADILGEISDILLEMEKQGTVERSYVESEKHRWKLIRPFFVSELIDFTLEDKFITKCRKPFQYGYCGVRHRASTKDEVRKHLTILIEHNPSIKRDILPEVFEFMVQERVASNPDFVPKIIKFINSEKDPSMVDKDLLYYINEYEESGRVRGTFIE